MTKQQATTASDHDSSLVLALELSGKSWELGAVVPGVARRPEPALGPALGRTRGPASGTT